MNQSIETFARNKIRELVSQLSDSATDTFRRCFSHKNLDRQMGEIIDSIPVDKLDSALCLCERTIAEYNLQKKWRTFSPDCRPDKGKDVLIKFNPEWPMISEWNDTIEEWRIQGPDGEFHIDEETLIAEQWQFLEIPT